MANNDGRREVVTDPLAPNPREQSPDRSLQLSGVHAPQIPSDASLTHDTGIERALVGVEGLLAREFEKKKDAWITEGKIAYQSGVTEQKMLETGNRFTAQGYHSLQARDTVNNWFTQQTVDLDEHGKQMEPAAYTQHLVEQRASMLSGITDPHARKVASAAFEDMAPRLAQKQAVLNSAHNRAQRVTAFSTVLASTGPTSATASRQGPNDPLPLSPVPVEAVMQPSARDRDVGVRTILGEAANQGTEGMAAVAHVMRNRAIDGRWPNSISGVALEPKQFSAWNAGPGGNAIPYNAKPGSPIYERAAAVFDAVMSGKHVDPTGGATHYYSPAGMDKLVADGDQPNRVPKWLAEETQRSGGSIKIGGHIFVGKAGNATVRPAVQETATTLAAGTEGDINAVPAAEHVGVTGVAQAKGANEVQQLIHGYTGLNSEDKATAVADAFRRTLDAGDETLFRDAGGIAVLHSLGAKPNEVDEVLKAHQRYTEKKTGEFNVEREQYSNNVLKRAEDGEDLGTILKDIDGKVKSHFLSDTAARSLAASAADKLRAESKDKSKMANTDMLNELGGLYQQIATGGDFKTLADEGTKIAKKYGATERDVQNIVGKMFSDSQQYQNNLRTSAQAAAKTKQEQDAIKANVSRNISQGYGLENVTGSVKVANDAGLPETVTAQEYGIRQIKDKAAKEYSDYVASGKMTAEQAKPLLERKVMLELQNHNVVDKQMQAQFVGSLSGNIISKDGTVKPAAKAAYDSWLTLKTTPGIKPDYLAKVVGDDATRNLLEHAFLLDSGDLSKDQALLKAHELLNDPNTDPEDKLQKDVVWKQKMNVDMKKTLLDRTHPGFLNSIFGTYDRSERERILTEDKRAEKYVLDRAEAYHFQNPNERGEVSLEKALQDLQAHAVPVMGNLVITKPGKELDKTMGVTGFGPNAAEEAISGYLRKNAATIWGKSYTDRQTGTLGAVAGAIGAVSEFDRQFSPQGIARAIAPGKFDSADNYKGERSKEPPMYITYNAELGVLTVDLYKDNDRKQTLGQPKHFNVKSIGAQYVKEQTKPGSWAKTWNSMFKGTAKAVDDALSIVE